MKRFNFKPLASVVLAALILSGCSALKKMKNNADQIDYQVTPEVLEAHAGQVAVDINGVFPAHYFHKKVKLVATPVLTYANGESPYSSVTVQGEKVDDNNKVISYTNGGNFAYKGAVNYVEDMRISDLKIYITASKGLKSMDFEPVKIASGVKATSTLVVNRPEPVLGVRREPNTTGIYDPNIDPFQRIVPDNYTADIKYLINKADVRSSELSKEEIKRLQEYTKDAYEAQRKELKGVEVSAYASPDGPLDFNTSLAKQREGTSSNYMKNQLRKDKVEAQLNTKFTPEDWEGFKTLMEKSTIQDKEMILRVLAMYSDSEVREREIKNLSEVFTVVAEQILPQLRRAKITANVDLIGKTDAEIAALAESDPASLNPAELLYAATLTTDKNKQLSIYNSFQRVYPNDWRGPNNAGYVLVQQGKYSDAKPLFEKADRLRNNEPVVKNNLGAIALYEGNVNQAETLFGAASGAGPEVDYNLGIVAIKKAEYGKAVRLLGDADSPNAGLARLLAGDNNGAMKSLENCTWEDSAPVEYMKAVVAARTGKENLMYESLQKAIRIDGKMKAKAATDLEFAAYFGNARFSDLVK